MSPRRDEDGYRYTREIRSYHSDADGKMYPVIRWALFERQDGTMRRVGTALDETDANAFIVYADVLIHNRTQEDTNAEPRQG